MKRILFTVSLLLLMSCGSDYHYAPDIVNAPVIYDQVFEGVYYFDNGGYLEIIQGEDNELTLVREGQSIQSINPKNGTLGSHPAIYYSGLEVINGVARFFMNVSYSSSTYDLEEDVSGRDITGVRRTDFELEMVGDHLQLTIKIYDGAINSNVNGVIATRVLRSI